MAAMAAALAFAAVASAAPEECGDVVNEDGVKASDALAVLQQAVGNEKNLACPSSVAAVLSFDAIWSPAKIPGNNGSTLLKPEVCRTSEYVARGGEVAVIAVSGTASPEDPAADVLYIEPMVSKDGGAYTLIMSGVAAESMIDGTAHASTVFALPLEVGIEYRFAAAFGSNQAIDVSIGTCQGTVQVLRPRL